MSSDRVIVDTIKMAQDLLRQNLPPTRHLTDAATVMRFRELIRSQAHAGRTLSCRVSASNNHGSTSATSAPVPPVLPVNLILPVISGLDQPEVGQELSCSQGTWIGAVDHYKQWQRGTTNIAGATASTYTPVAADVAQTLRCMVTGTNPGGSLPVYSNTTQAVIP
jgi:hypothetical protein